MASYHLSVKTIKRSAGRSATAAAAYRSGERLECEREGRVHDYTRKSGIEETFIVAPEHAPDWAQDRGALWNAAEASETRRNSVTAREWELALPSEVSAGERSQITRAFAEELVARYGVAVDVAIHAPHREGDQRNHHAHVLTSTRKLEPEGFTGKTRVLDAAKTGGVEIAQMRGVWAELQNRALERAGRERGLGEGEIKRVDHRSLEVQRSEAMSRGDDLTAQGLDRAPELKLGPAANAMERRERRAAEREGRDYQPVTERGAVVHGIRQAREVFAEMRERLEMARGAYDGARDAGQGRVSAGLAALRAAVDKDRNAERGLDDIQERLAQITGRVEREVDLERDGIGRGRDRLRETLDRGSDGLDASKEVETPSIRERLDDVLNKPRAQLEAENETQKAREIKNEREIDRTVERDLSL